MRNKLFTAAVNKQLANQYKYGSDLSKQKVVTKIFNPYGEGRWYLLNSDPNDPDYIWAIVTMYGNVEIGSVSRRELESLRLTPFRLPLQRDIYFDPINAEEVFNGLVAGKFYADGGEIVTEIRIGDPILYDYKLMYVTVKDGEYGLLNNHKNNSTNVFIPLKLVDKDKLTDVHGKRAIIVERPIKDFKFVEKDISGIYADIKEFVEVNNLQDLANEILHPNYQDWKHTIERYRTGMQQPSYYHYAPPWQWMDEVNLLVHYLGDKYNVLYIFEEDSERKYKNAVNKYAPIVNYVHNYDGDIFGYIFVIPKKKKKLGDGGDVDMNFAKGGELPSFIDVDLYYHSDGNEILIDCDRIAYDFEGKLEEIGCNIHCTITSDEEYVDRNGIGGEKMINVYHDEDGTINYDDMAEDLEDKLREYDDSIRVRCREKKSFAKGGVVEYIHKGNDRDNLYYKRFNGAIGSFAWRYDKRYNEGIIYPLDDFDMEYYSHLKLKPNEVILRYRSERMIGDVKYLIKFNLEKSLVYFMDSDKMSDDDDKNIIFQGRGIPMEYMVLDWDKIYPSQQMNVNYAKGGEMAEGGAVEEEFIQKDKENKYSDKYPVITAYNNFQKIYISHIKIPIFKRGTQIGRFSVEGTGDTKKKAFENLQKEYDKYLENSITYIKNHKRNFDGIGDNTIMNISGMPTDLFIITFEYKDGGENKLGKSRSIEALDEDEAVEKFRDQFHSFEGVRPKIISVQKFADGGMMAKGGVTGYERLVKKVAKNYEGKNVPRKYQSEYGKTYNKEEAKEVGYKVATKVYGMPLAKMKK